MGNKEGTRAVRGKYKNLYSISQQAIAGGRRKEAKEPQEGVLKFHGEPKSRGSF